MARPLIAFVLGFFQRLRFPWLFGLVAALFTIDFVVPDMLPFADELLLGAATIFLGAWKIRAEQRRVAARELQASPPQATASAPKKPSPEP